MENISLGAVNGRRLLVLAGPPVVVVALLAGLIRVRPGLGWMLLLVTGLLAGTVVLLLGDDTRGESVDGAARYGGVGTDVAPGVEDGGHLRGRLGLLVVYSMETALLVILYVVASAAGARLL